MPNEAPLSSFMREVEVTLIERVRNAVELLFITSSVALLIAYLISIAILSPYFYFALYAFYFLIGYEIWKVVKLSKSYLKLLGLTEGGEKVNRVRRGFLTANSVVLVFNVAFAMLIIYDLSFLLPLLVSLVLYLYSSVDERLASRKAVLAAALVSSAFSALAFYDPRSSLVLVALAYLVDLTVMKLGT